MLKVGSCVHYMLLIYDNVILQLHDYNGSVGGVFLIFYFYCEDTQLFTATTMVVNINWLNVNMH